MMYSEDQELSEQERAALAALPRELAPSDLLEERVVRALKQEGHLGTARKAGSLWRKTAWRAAAAAALFAGGVATGRYLTAEPTSRAAVIAPASVPQSGDRDASHRNPSATQVKNGEKVVAEREMWL